MPKLFMVLLGAYPKGRLTEQHDIFFGIASSTKALTEQIIESWPEANGAIHIDAWREVTFVNGYAVGIVPKTNNNFSGINKKKQLFFLNLGGYKPNELEEFHYKMITVANNKAEAIQQAKKTAFFKHTGFKGAVSHIDDKYGIDVDDVFKIEDILSDFYKEKYSINLIETANGEEDELRIGYSKLNK